MSLFRKNLEEALTYYDNVHEMFSRQLTMSPQGILLYQKNHGKDQFLHAYLQDGRRKRKCITKNQEMQKALAQKEFARKAVKLLEQNTKVLEHAINNMVPFDPDEILRSMTRGYEKLPQEYFFDRDIINIDMHLDGEIKAKIDRHREWGRQPYEQSDYMTQYRKHTTSRGLKVRSKSEVLICEDCYKWYNLPFRYEQVLVVDGMTIWPDFTFEDYKRELFFWEHLGMMDDPNYADRNFRKLERYYAAGLIPGDNLILSFDRRGDIDMRIIDDIIRNQVIPRL